jgi:hypothetical protein
MLELMSRLVGVKAIRDLLLNSLIIKGAGIDRMPEPAAEKPE